MIHEERGYLPSLTPRGSGGIALGLGAFLVAALVFFTEMTLTCAKAGEVSIGLVVTMFCQVIIYTSLSDSGAKRAEEREEVQGALLLWRTTADRVRVCACTAKLSQYLLKVAKREREEYQRGMLLSHGIDEERFAAYAAGERAGERRDLRVMRRAMRLPLLSIKVQDLLFGAACRRRALLPTEPGRMRLRATVRAMLPALVGSLLTVGVVFQVRDGIDFGVVVSVCMKLLALLYSGARGYAMGVRSVTEGLLASLRMKVGYLEEFLAEEVLHSEIGKEGA